jgi:hypothetical protein
MQFPVFGFVSFFRYCSVCLFVLLGVLFLHWCFIIRKTSFFSIQWLTTLFDIFSSHRQDVFLSRQWLTTLFDFFSSHRQDVFLSIQWLTIHCLPNFVFHRQNVLLSRQVLLEVLRLEDAGWERLSPLHRLRLATM